jgi:hypothetical protein
MRVSLEDLKKAVKWVQENSKAVAIEVDIEDGRRLKFVVEDKYERMTKITMYSVDGSEKALLKAIIEKAEHL